LESTIVGTIVIGSISGVFAAGLLWVIKYLFTQQFVPFYQAAIYKGSSIQDAWVAYAYEDGVRNDALATISIKQSAHNINATYVMHFGNGENLTFECEGEYWEGYLSLRGKSKLQTNYNILTTLLKLRDNGAVLHGDVSFRHRAEDRPYTLVGWGFQRHGAEPTQEPHYNQIGEGQD